MEWQQVELGEVLKPTKNSAAISPETVYSQITVRLYGKGVIERGKILGRDIGSKQYTASEGQFIISKIDARNGAFGLVPKALDGAVVTGDFLLYQCAKQLLPSFLYYLANTPYFVDECVKSSEGSTNRVRLKPDKFLAMEIPLPPLAEQQRLVARLEQVQRTVAEIKRLRTEQQHELRLLLRQQFRAAIAGAGRLPMGQVAPIVRRPVEVDEAQSYPELGIRSFGKGTFHKPIVPGREVGTKKLYYIQPGDLLFSNVFAWEGAIAVATPADTGCVGSHRFISCLCDENQALPAFLRYYFLTPEGMVQINAASPGGAGRNKTLGLEKLERLLVPVPPLPTQRAFLALQARLDQLTATQHAAQAELDLLLPATLDKAFRGEL